MNAILNRRTPRLQNKSAEALQNTAVSASVIVLSIPTSGYQYSSWHIVQYFINEVVVPKVFNQIHMAQH